MKLEKLVIKVSVVEFSNALLGKQLDNEGSLILKTAVESQGIEVILGDAVTVINGEKSVTSVTLKSGKTFDAQLVLFSTGIAPNKTIADKTTISTNRGILVNDYMETNVKDIYACGDIAEFESIVYGNWPDRCRHG